MRNLFSLLLFQIGWWATVFLVSKDYALTAVFILLGFSLIHLFFFSLEGETEFILEASLFKRAL